MSYCPYCGGQLQLNAPFCPYCGQAVSGAASIPVMPASGTQDYSLVLVSTGSCPQSQADDVIEDVLGYSGAEARSLVQMAPTQIAQYLTMQQAQYAAQALTEYGMQVAVFNGANAVDLGQYATGSVFNNDGSFIAGALAALATITVANRIKRFTRWSRPSLLSYLFAPRYRAPAPPRHVRRIIHRPLPVQPAPRSVPRGLKAPRIRDDRSPAGGSRGPTGGSRGIGALGFGLVSGNRSTGSGNRGPGGISRSSGGSRGPGGMGGSRGPGGMGGSRGPGGSGGSRGPGGHR